MSSIIPTTTGYVHKKTIYGEFVVSLIRRTWDDECNVSMILAGKKVEERKFATSLSTAMEQYDMFCNLAKNVADHYKQTSIYLRRRDEESSAVFNGEANGN